MKRSDFGSVGRTATMVDEAQHRKGMGSPGVHYELPDAIDASRRAIAANRRSLARMRQVEKLMKGR